MAKRKGTKGQTTIYKTLSRKLRSNNTNPTKSRGWTWVLRKLRSTSGTRHGTLVTNLVISHEWVKDREVLTTSEHIRSHLLHRYSITEHQVIVPTVKFRRDDFNLSNRTPQVDSVASLLGATLYQGNPHRNHKLWNIVSTERTIYSPYAPVALFQ